MAAALVLRPGDQVTSQRGTVSIRLFCLEAQAGIPCNSTIDRLKVGPVDTKENCSSHGFTSRRGIIAILTHREIASAVAQCAQQLHRKNASKTHWNRADGELPVSDCVVAICYL